MVIGDDVECLRQTQSDPIVKKIAGQPAFDCMRESEAAIIASIAACGSAPEIAA